jgi:DNA-binding protein HU-beta
MFKKDLIDAMAATTKQSKAKTQKALEALLKVASTTLTKGEKIELTGFGSFSVQKRAARQGRNLHTNKPMQIPAMKVVRFKSGATLSKHVNNKK